MANNHYSYYSRGFVVEYLDTGEDRCSSWLLLPAENLWPEWFRGLIYCIALFYFFVGIAIASDIFMCSIEVITARKRTISKWDPEKNEMVQREVLIWNETVANLTLMALGSSAPEILLAVVEAVTSLDDDEPADSLGTFTIIGSAAFNMLIITAVCIVSVPLPQSKSIKEFGVFVVTGVWSIWAYIWMLLVVDYISPGVVEPWEAWVTLLYLPVLVLMAYLQDLGWCCCNRKRVGDSEDADDPTMNVRVVTSHPHPQFLGHQHKELHVLEAQKAHRMSEHTSNLPAHSSPERELQAKINKPSATLARARFRHAVVGSLLGSKAFRPHSSNRPARLAEVVEVVSSWNDAMKQGKAPDLADSLGKFTFGSDRYAVLESAGKLDIEIFFHRKMPPRHKILNLDTTSLAPQGNNIIEPITPSSVAPSVTEAVTVDFETREGSAKPGKDFRYTQGTLVFQENEYRKVISIPIINDNQYEADVDFYVILKNAHGGAGIGDPSVTRITIVDDDEPGEFEFEQSHYNIDMKTGKVAIRIMREHGFDGKVSMDFNTT
ncbi:sodium/calcium exchanger 3 [Elysia marginata]|uniref:Sodium/calcium exchanger 3 n=1 Tax=Elysia marginata TaxID=1093978 RepID=A0AAV4IBH9_9GAST|nr:sodium/calcium exchanger 3 [Elysia marginata]